MVKRLIKTKEKFKTSAQGRAGWLPVAGVMVVAGVAAGSLRALPTSAETSDVALKVVASCSMTGTVDTEHSKTIINGQYEAGIGQTTLDVTCNDANGFEIYALGVDGTGAEAAARTTLVDATSGATIATGLYPGAGKVLNSTPSSWSMKLATNDSSVLLKNNDEDFSDYHVVPGTSTLAASRAAGVSGGTATASELTTTYDAFVNQTQVSGSYVGYVKYTMTQIAAIYGYNYNITLNANGGTFSGSATTKILSGEVPSGEGVVLPSATTDENAPTRSGYTFKGSWCSQATTNDGATCGGTTYTGATAAVTGDLTTTLYAMWAETAPDYCATNGIADSNCMQKMALSDCPTSAKTVTDARDGKTYTIAKLSDNKCWMTTSLNLAGGTKLYAATSNVTTSGYTLPASSTSGFSDDTTAYVYNSNSTSCGNNSPCYSYYSYIAATAGSGSSVTTDGYNASESICPKGWRLPTATTSNANAQSNNNWKTGDFYALATAYGANLESNYYQSAATFYNNAGPGKTPNFLLSGYYNGGSFDNGGSDGYYWSSTAYSSTSAYYLTFASGGVSSADDNNRRNGFAVRCVFGS